MSLYLDHFGLSEPPFRITPDTDFFFTGANRGPTLEALIYAITQDEGIVKVSGEVGSGKTMLCRMLLERLPETVETLYLANPALSREEILGAIADELGLPTTGGSTHSRIRALQDALVERYAAGKRVVLLIDEAHAMPAESLEEIRLLSNLETRSAKLLQIALFAQPELDQRLMADDMRQLRERITQHFNLAPLKPGDIGQYIEFRLRAAAYRGPQPFTAAAIALIAEASTGLSRRINILADKALLAAYSDGTHQVDTAQAKAAIRDANFSPIRAAPSHRLPWRAIAWGVGSACAVLALASTAFFLRPTPPVDSPPTPLPPPAAGPTTGSTDGYGPLTHQAMARFAPWLAEAPANHYFLQFFATDADKADEAERYLAQLDASVDRNQLRAYRSALSGKDRIGLIYGDYPSRESALQAARQLSTSPRHIQAIPRQVNKLR